MTLQCKVIFVVVENSHHYCITSVWHYSFVEMIPKEDMYYLLHNKATIQIM